MATSHSQFSWGIVQWRLLINLVIALFALVAIDSSDESWTYLRPPPLLCGILLDIFSFILFSRLRYGIIRLHITLTLTSFSDA
ncbi:hypothetical protein Scep_027728 [Stephania cephalantha]|uniref:Uncharacterized protein n=1 Tax=Stephania cephalantha TaxID=152367 RepID=A0AAP0E8M7_9MAGN